MQMSLFKTDKSHLPEWVVPVVRLVTHRATGEWCKLPYPGHPAGCPNYGKKSTCPPLAPSVGEYFDISKSLYLVHSEFDLVGHAARMKSKHPSWSERQCRCCLYWQPTSRRQMGQRVFNAVSQLGTDAIAQVPEAMGVNVFATARLSGLKLERIRNLKTCRHVSLIGHKAIR